MNLQKFVKIIYNRPAWDSPGPLCLPAAFWRTRLLGKRRAIRRPGLILGIQAIMSKSHVPQTELPETGLLARDVTLLHQFQQLVNKV